MADYVSGTISSRNLLVPGIFIETGELILFVMSWSEIISPCSCSRLMWWTTSSRMAGTVSLSFRRWSGWDWLLPWPSSSSYCLDSPCSPPSPPRTDLTIPREKPLPSMLMSSCECWETFCITISILSWLVLHQKKNYVLI